MVSLKESLENIKEARTRTTGTIVVTPLQPCDWLSEETGFNILMKLESEQITKSFKLRGACNKLKKIQNEKKDEKIVTASSGNHALACAHVAQQLGLNLSIFTYVNVAKVKEEKLLKYKNVELTKYGQDCCEAEVAARNDAQSKNLLYVSPYNDSDVIYGQGTIALELIEQCENLDAVLVPVGGGGLIGGIALGIKSIRPNIKVIGCQPVVDCCMYESIKAGRIVEDNVFQDSFSDGTGGRVEPGSITYDICRDYVDDWILLTEEEIEQAVFDVLDKSKKIIEGAAGLVVAGVRKIDPCYKNMNIALVICGGNIGVEKLKDLLNKHC